MQAISRTFSNWFSPAIRAIPKNPRLLVISALAGAILIGIGLILNRWRKGFKAKETSPSSESDKVNNAATRLLSSSPRSSPEETEIEDAKDLHAPQASEEPAAPLLPPLSGPSPEEIKIQEAFKDLLEPLATLFGSKEKVEGLPCNPEKRLSAIHLQHPIEKGLRTDSSPFLIAKVSYSLTDDEIAKFPKAGKRGRKGQDYQQNPEAESYVTLVYSKEKWIQVQQGTRYPNFFPNPVETLDNEQLKNLFQKGECLDPSLGFKWSLKKD